MYILSKSKNTASICYYVVATAMGIGWYGILRLASSEEFTNGLSILLPISVLMCITSLLSSMIFRHALCHITSLRQTIEFCVLFLIVAGAIFSIVLILQFVPYSLMRYDGMHAAKMYSDLGFILFLLLFALIKPLVLFMLPTCIASVYLLHWISSAFQSTEAIPDEADVNPLGKRKFINHLPYRTVWATVVIAFVVYVFSFSILNQVKKRYWPGATEFNRNRPCYEKIIENIQGYNIGLGESKYLRFVDVQSPGNLWLSNEYSQEPYYGPAIQAQRLRDGRLLIIIITVDQGHGGLYGYAYSSSGHDYTQEYLDGWYGPGWYINTRLDANWCAVSNHLG